MNKETFLRDTKARFRLTDRETDTLRGLLDGLKNADIAQNMMIAEQTVKDHLSRVYKKMGVKNRFELMRSLVRSSGRKTRAHISAHVHAEKEPAEQSLTDELTGTYNRRAFLALAQQQIKVARRQKKNVCMLHAEVKGSETVTDTTGPDGRGVLLRDAANILKDTFRESDVIARVGGREFIVIPLGATEAEADKVVARLQENIEHFNSKRNCEQAISISYGTSLCDPESRCRIDELLRQEDSSTDKDNKTKDDEREDSPLKR